MVHMWGSLWVLFPRYLLTSVWDRVSHWPWALPSCQTLWPLNFQRSANLCLPAHHNWHYRYAPPLYLVFYLSAGVEIQVLTLARSMLYWPNHLPRFPPWILERSQYQHNIFIWERCLLPSLERSVAKISSLTSNLVCISRQHIVIDNITASTDCGSPLCSYEFSYSILKDSVDLAVRSPHPPWAFL